VFSCILLGAFFFYFIEYKKIQGMNVLKFVTCVLWLYKGADKSLARPGRKQATATDFDFHLSSL
jgi:hypothetical protein